MHHARHRSAAYDLTLVAMTVLFALRKVARRLGVRARGERGDAADGGEGGGAGGGRQPRSLPVRWCG